MKAYLLTEAQNGGTWHTARHLALVIGSREKATYEARHHADSIHGGIANIVTVELDTTKPIVVNNGFGDCIKVDATEI